MGFISGFKEGLEAWIKKVFKKRRAKIGIYGPPNAGKTTLANRICMIGTRAQASALSRPFPTRLAGP